MQYKPIADQGERQKKSEKRFFSLHTLYLQILTTATRTPATPGLRARTRPLPGEATHAGLVRPQHSATELSASNQKQVKEYRVLQTVFYDYFLHVLMYICIIPITDFFPYTDISINFRIHGCRKCIALKRSFFCPFYFSSQSGILCVVESATLLGVNNSQKKNTALILGCGDIYTASLKHGHSNLMREKGVV